MNLLITGGAGFIGSNFILYWLTNHPQDKIINFDKLTYAGNLNNLLKAKNNSNYFFVKGDICDIKAVERVFQDIDIVVNFAAESHVDRSIQKPSSFILTNVVGTQILLEAALKNKIKKFHHISTDEVFGSLELNETNKFNERSCYKPRSPYSASKAASDHLVRAYYATYGLPITITNCSNNYGPYQFPEKLIPLAITNIIENKKVPIYGDGLYVRDWLYVEDHVKAIERVLENGINGQTYLVGGMTENISNLELIKKILKIMGKNEEENIEFIKDRLGHDRRYAVDWSKIKNELDWTPLYNFEEWLGKTIEWYLKNEWWWKPLKKTL